MIESKGFVGSQRIFDGPGDPIQHLLEAQQFQKQLRFPAVLAFGEAKMDPHPHVAQHKGNAHEQQPLSWIARASLDSGLVHLAIACFDAKTLAVDFANVFESPSYFPDRIEEFLSAPLAGLLVRVVKDNQRQVPGPAAKEAADTGSTLRPVGCGRPFAARRGAAV